MGVPSISERKYYRQVPGEADEPTSTIVLTSKDSYFVDVRLLRKHYEAEKGKGSNTMKCIDWAFAGNSRAKPQEGHENGMSLLSHTVWDHWIDSKSNNPGVDEGDMWLQEDGDVLERGKQKNPDTGEETTYEELWHDLEVIPLGDKRNRSSVVMRTDDQQKDVRGMAVKIGGWCQGILKTRNDLTVERWERKPTDDGESLVYDDNEEGRTRNDWIRTFRCGQGALPCRYMCSNTSGKLGMETVERSYLDDDRNQFNGWRVLEEYYW